MIYSRAVNAFGANQWAFTPGLSARDLITINVLTWILSMNVARKVGIYLSDISGALRKNYCRNVLIVVFTRT